MASEQLEASSENAKRTMRANRRRDTGPELRLRSALHRAGLRFRVDHSLNFDRRRRADVVFTKQKVAVFVDGCFWHGCPEHCAAPKANADFWAQKIGANRSRDRDTDSRLEAEGWKVIRFWEHEDLGDEAVALVSRAVHQGPSNSSNIA
jgi:DNA mismatch endonuclease (patch repair protein)